MPLGTVRVIRVIESFEVYSLALWSLLLLAFDRSSPDDASPASFIYTSGTTGRQKGAVLTHRNFMSNVESIAKTLDFNKEDNFVLVLPLHHSFAFTATVLVPIYKHCQVTMVENLKTIKANMAETSPTVMLAVPLLLEKMLARVMDNINGKKLAKLMYNVGLAKVVGKKVKEGLGGKLRLVEKGGGTLLNTYEGHTHESFPLECTFSHTDEHVLGASEDGAVVCWDLVEGKVVHRIEAHSRPVSSLAYHPSKTMLLTASYDGLVKVWTGVPG